MSRSVSQCPDNSSFRIPHSALLYLVPTPLADDTAPQVLPPQVVAAVAALSYFLVENARTARRFVKNVAPHRVIEDIRFVVIDKDSTDA